MRIKQLIKELEQLTEELERAKIPCARCNGSGWITTPEWEKYWETRNKIAEKIEKENPDKSWIQITELVDAETRHLEPGIPEEDICPDCEGDGYTLTDDAMQLLRLLNKLLYLK